MASKREKPHVSDLIDMIQSMKPRTSADKRRVYEAILAKLACLTPVSLQILSRCKYCRDSICRSTNTVATVFVAANTVATGFAITNTVATVFVDLQILSQV